MNIKGKRIIIRAVEMEDLAALHTWSNDPEVAGGLIDLHFPSSRQQQQEWFARIQREERTVRLAVQTHEAALIGYTGFWSIDWRDRTAEHALVVGEKAYRGQGYGREIIMACARYAFEEMDLYRLDAAILETNTASLKTYQACGFQLEGKLREHALRAGQRINVLMLGLLATEYAELAARTGYWNE